MVMVKLRGGEAWGPAFPETLTFIPPFSRIISKMRVWESVSGGFTESGKVSPAVGPLGAPRGAP
jgi:hypothetical protein